MTGQTITLHRERLDDDQEVVVEPFDIEVDEIVGVRRYVTEETRFQRVGRIERRYERVTKFTPLDEPLVHHDTGGGTLLDVRNYTRAGHVSERNPTTVILITETPQEVHRLVMAARRRHRLAATA